MGGWLEAVVFRSFISVDRGKRGNTVSCPLFIIHTVRGSSLYKPQWHLTNMRRYRLSWLLRSECLFKLSWEFFFIYTELSPLNKCPFLSVDPVHMKQVFTGFKFISFGQDFLLVTLIKTGFFKKRVKAVFEWVAYIKDFTVCERH